MKTALRLLIFLAPLFAGAQNLKEFEKKVTEFTLPNGLHFIVVERHEAPVVSFHTYVNAGSVDDPSGATGIAHMFEHMAFKGTPTIGTRNWGEEKKALAAVEAAYDALEAERRRGPLADQQKIKALETRLHAEITKANAYVEPNEFPRIIEENGGAGLNASTGMDSTSYYYSLPSNRIELWFLLESQRFVEPVFREFYKERDVVMEEYRMRVESNPQGKLFQAFLGTAFLAHPYRVMGTGWPADIVNLRVRDALNFYNTWYAPANLTIAISGDVKPEEARRLAEKYFGRMPNRPPPPLLHTKEPPQAGPKLAQVESPSQPVLLIGYKRPDQYSPDDPVLDVISGILSSGRTGVLYRELVRDKRLALAAQAGASFPASKYPNVFVFLLAPALGHTVEENEKAFYDLLERFKSEKVDPEALARVKTKTRASLIRQLASNAGLASLLTAYHADYGDWRKLFTQLEEIDKVTVDDVQRVARRYFVPESRTVAYTYQPKPQAKPQTGGVK
ncbi:MAG TPA: pitrilysin family protein [Bryobacteraceae bacterium]|nr:pitrilysin family protein [Bryobacteraceae bacterium]